MSFKDNVGCQLTFLINPFDAVDRFTAPLFKRLRGGGAEAATL